MNATPSLASDASAISSEPRPRILIADDSRVIRLAIKKILGTQYDIVQVENGAHAWDRVVQDRGIQALVTDIEMPQMDGYELICRIRAADDARIRDLPVITITGTDDEYVRHRAFACGATDFITKPLDSIQLLARVRAYVQYEEATRELTERALSLEEQAVTDPLTGLRSRRYLMQRGEQDVAYSLRHGRDLTMIRIDIDGFKQIYRTHGDEMSDRLLAWLAKLLFRNARTEDTVARVSGAEFAILATATNLDDAAALCDRVREAVASQPFSYGDVSIPVTMSMGLACLITDRRDNIESLLKLANQRLSRARSEGGDRICASVIGDAAAAVEEVTLAPPGSGAQSEPAATEVLAPLPELGDLAALDAVSDEEPTQAVEVADTPVSVAIEPDAPADDANDLISVDRALALLAVGKGHLLGPYLEALVRRVDPLLEFYHSRRFGGPKS
jgi:two-component system cell cycle response regulator